MTNKSLTMGAVAAAGLMLAGGQANAKSWAPTFPSSVVRAAMAKPANADPPALITVGSPEAQGLAQAFRLHLEPLPEPNFWKLVSTPIGGAVGGLNDIFGLLKTCIHACEISPGLTEDFPFFHPQNLSEIVVEFKSGTSVVSASVSLSGVDHNTISMTALNSSGVSLGGCGANAHGGDINAEGEFVAVFNGSCGFPSGVLPVSSGSHGTFELSTADMAPDIRQLVFSGPYAFPPGVGVGFLHGVKFAAPEPATLGLMVLGLLGGAGFAGRKRRN